MNRRVKKHLSSKTFQAALVGVAAKAVEKTVPSVTLWWLAVGAAALLWMGYWASDEES